MIQKAFDELSKCDVANLISTFKGNGNVLLCLHDHNGNHVIQKCITILFGMAKEAQERGEDELCSFFLCSLEPIIDEIIGSVEDLSRHPYGCRAVQRIVEHCIDPQKDRILDSIIACQRSLLEDQYGNYAVQNMLAHGRPSDRDAVFKSITANNSVIKFSKQKHASNVVEAMLRLGNIDQRHQIVQEMLNVRILTSYVVKTALEVLEGGEQNYQLFSELLSNLGELVRLLLLVPDNSVPYIMSTDISFVYPTIQRRGLRLPSILLPRSKCIHQGWVFCPQSNNIACTQSCQKVKHTNL